MGKSGFALVMAGVLAALAYVGMRKLNQDRAQEYKTKYESMKIIVAQNPLQPGDKLQDASIGTTEIPRTALRPFMITNDNRNAYLYRPVVRRIERGHPIFTSDLGIEGERSDATRVENGYRLVSIAVDDVSGVSGLVQRGDRVDILMTLSLNQGQGGSSQKGDITRMLLTNVLVQETGGAGGRRRRLEETSREYSTVTLVVTPREAEILGFAQAKGRTLLLLRGPGAAGPVEALPAITMESVFKESDAALKTRRDAARTP